MSQTAVCRRPGVDAVNLYASGLRDAGGSRQLPAGPAEGRRARHLAGTARTKRKPAVISRRIRAASHITRPQVVLACDLTPCYTWSHEITSARSSGHHPAAPATSAPSTRPVDGPARRLNVRGRSTALRRHRRPTGFPRARTPNSQSRGRPGPVLEADARRAGRGHAPWIRRAPTAALVTPIRGRTPAPSVHPHAIGPSRRRAS